MVQISRPLSAPIHSGLRISLSDHAMGLRVALLTATALPRMYQKEHPADALVMLPQSGLLRRPRDLDTIQVIPLWPVTPRRQRFNLDGSKSRTPHFAKFPGSSPYINRVAQYLPARVKAAQPCPRRRGRERRSAGT